MHCRHRQTDGHWHRSIIDITSRAKNCPELKIIVPPSTFRTEILTLTLTFNPIRATVINHTHAKGQGHRSRSLKVRVETDKSYHSSKILDYSVRDNDNGHKMFNYFPLVLDLQNRTRSASLLKHRESQSFPVLELRSVTSASTTALSLIPGCRNNSVTINMYLTSMTIVLDPEANTKYFFSLALRKSRSLFSLSELFRDA